VAIKQSSVGIVKTQYADIGELKLESGDILPNVRLAYETYGKLNRDKSNAVLVFHALTGDAHAAGKHRKTSRKSGWYDLAIGPKKTFDTNKLFVICINVLGGCRGTTGPSSINPKTKRQYGLDFPEISIRDIVRTQKKLITQLGIKKLFCITGGSMGGMLAIQWLSDYPDSANCAIAIACTAREHPFALAFNDIGRKAIMNDLDWQKGNYYGKGVPKKGLSLARQIGHVTYLSPDTFERKFGRERRKRQKGAKFGAEFEVQKYLNYQGKLFVKRFDANSYLYLTGAVDNFDLTEGGKKQLPRVFAGIKAKFLLVSFTSDWLYPPQQVEEIYTGLAEAGVPVVYRKIDLPYGHDAFLVYNNTLGNAMIDFLDGESKTAGIR